MQTLKHHHILRANILTSLPLFANYMKMVKPIQRSGPNSYVHRYNYSWNLITTVKWELNSSNLDLILTLYLCLTLTPVLSHCLSPAIRFTGTATRTRDPPACFIIDRSHQGKEKEIRFCGLHDTSKMSR